MFCTLPTSYSRGRSFPLVVLLHPLGVNGTTFEQITGFSALADAKGFVAAYPDGTPNATVRSMGLATDLAWNAGGGFAPSCVSDDQGFINSVVNDILGAYSIDQHRIYVVGMSNGGMLAYDLSARVSSPFQSHGGGGLHHDRSHLDAAKTSACPAHSWDQ